MSGSPVRVDLAALLPLAGDGVHWTLDGDTELNANLVHLDPGHQIGEHVNDAVDVLIVVVGGAGEALVDDAVHRLAAGTVVHVPRGCRRCIVAGPEGVDYLTVHRRRGGLAVGRRR